VVAVAGTAGAASAQTAQATSGDIAVGYAYLHDAQFELPAGWLFSAAGSLTPTIGIVGEIGGNYHGLDGARVSEHSFVGGVRFHAPNASMVTPFAQLLAGTSLFGATDSGRSDSFLVYTVQPGGGMDIQVARNLRARLQADYRYNRRGGAGPAQFRLSTGVVYGFGGTATRHQHHER